MIQYTFKRDPDAHRWRATHRSRGVTGGGTSSGKAVGAAEVRRWLRSHCVETPPPLAQRATDPPVPQGGGGRDG